MTTPAVESLPAAALERYLTAERLVPYRAAAGAGLADAVRLHQWNGLASGAMYETIGSVEVLIRNAIDLQLQDWHRQSGDGGDWWEDPLGLLDARRQQDVEKARSRVTQVLRERPRPRAAGVSGRRTGVGGGGGRASAGWSPAPGR